MRYEATIYRISPDGKQQIKDLAAEYGNGMSNRFLDALCLYASTGEPVINGVRVEDCLQDIIKGKWLSGRLTSDFLKADQRTYEQFKFWLDGEDGFGSTLLELLSDYDTVKRFFAAKPQWISTLQEQFLDAENGAPLKNSTVSRYVSQWYEEKEQNGESSKALAAVIRKNRAARLRKNRIDEEE